MSSPFKKYISVENISNDRMLVVFSVQVVVNSSKENVNKNELKVVFEEPLKMIEEEILKRVRPKHNKVVSEEGDLLLLQELFEDDGDFEGDSPDTN